MNKQGRRQGYLINRRYQLKYVLAFTGLTVAALVTTTALILSDITDQINAYIARPDIDISRTGDIVLPVVVRISAWVTLVYLLVLTLVTIYYIARTRSLVESVGEGTDRLSRGELGFRFRVSDCSDFGKMEDSFNEMLEANRGRIEGLMSVSEEIDREIEGLSGMSAGDTAKAGRIKAVEEKLDKLDGMLAGYRLG